MTKNNILVALGKLVMSNQESVIDDPCPGCQKGTVCRTPACGRLKLRLDTPNNKVYTTSTPELLPCPFCGNSPRHLESKAGYYDEKVICDTCKFSLPPSIWQSRAKVPNSETIAAMQEAREIVAKKLKD